jgi:outer membrane immunogenic protein
MFRATFLGLVGAALISPANAADLGMGGGGTGGYKDEYVPAAIWTGLYAGVNSGFGWNGTASRVAATAQDTAYGYFPWAGTAGANSTRFDGSLGGGQVGYNFQSGRYVFGIESDIEASALAANTSVTVLSGVPSGFGSAAATSSSDLGWFGTVRGRLGYTWDAAMLYATGGLAYGDVKRSLGLTISNAYATGNATAAAHSESIETGYTVGAGFEYLIAPRWSLKAEYQYIDLGNGKSLSAAANYGPWGGNTAGTATSHTSYDAISSGRIGVNYHVGAISEPLK